MSPTLRRVPRLLFLLLLLPVLYLLLWPVPIDPEVWTPPAPRAWVPTGTLAGAQRVELPDGHGPEDLELDAQGRVVTGLHDGRILRWPVGADRTGQGSAGGDVEVVAQTGGRPLGMDRDREGRIIIADAWKGLLRLEADGTLTVLTTTCGGKELIFTDDPEVAPDGSIWFTDATVRFRQPDWKLDLIDNRPNGRLCVWNPITGTTREVLSGLYFANGVAVDPGGQFVLVNETSRYRVQRLWISGPRAGEQEVFVDSLPGFPDGISTGIGPDGSARYWIAVASPRNPMLDAAAGWPVLRRMMVRLPAALQPAPERTARAIALDADGKTVHDLYDPQATAIAVVTSVEERGGRLYLGSLSDTAWASLPAP